MKFRARPGYTHDPWPCCGTAAGAYGRPKGKICDDCKALIAEGKVARAAAADQKAKGEQAVYGWTERDYGWPRYYAVPGDFTNSEAHEQLANAMFACVNALSTPAPADTPRESPEYTLERQYVGVPSGREGHKRRQYLPWPRVLPVDEKKYDSWGFHTLRLMNPAHREALVALDLAIRAALEDRYEAGKQRGRSLLLGLAQGEHTITDFEEKQQTERERIARRR